jgi:hypothetical protein
MLGLAATAAEEAKKLPETLPNAMTTVPMIAVSTAMQASLRVQQHIAILAAKGDEVLSQLRGTSEEAPPWATFDDPPAEPDDSASKPRAAFDRIDYDHTGFTEGDESSRGRWDAVGVADEDGTSDAAPTSETPTAQTETSQTPTAQTPTAQTETSQTPTAQTGTATMETPDRESAADQAVENTLATEHTLTATAGKDHAMNNNGDSVNNSPAANGSPPTKAATKRPAKRAAKKATAPATDQPPAAE